MQAYSNPCIRCGKDRIVSKTWTEQVGMSLLTRSETICPDSECQKAVDDDLEEKRLKKEAIMNRKNSQKQNLAPQK